MALLELEELELRELMKIYELPGDTSVVSTSGLGRAEITVASPIEPASTGSATVTITENAPGHDSNYRFVLTRDDHVIAAGALLRVQRQE